MSAFSIGLGLVWLGASVFFVLIVFGLIAQVADHLEHYEYIDAIVAGAALLFVMGLFALVIAAGIAFVEGRLA